MVGNLIYYLSLSSIIGEGATPGSPEGDPGAPDPLSCGEYRAVRSVSQTGSDPSDRILFRKDWDHLALALDSVRVVEPSVYYERAKRASRARRTLQCRCVVVYHPKEITTPVVMKPSAGELIYEERVYPFR